MPIARFKQVDLSVTPYYHCYARCVRRGYLLGNDEKNNNYDHRKGWIVAQLNHLTHAFAIQVCAYAVMSNHYHLVVHVDKALALSWEDDEVVARWGKAWGRKHPIENYTPQEVARWRDNLASLSWFMRLLNEPIARRANKEDDVKGHFWESRFQSQALIDDASLLACMVYVDLNPIRAKAASTLETSDYTSIQQRLKAYQKQQETPTNLMPCHVMPPAIPIKSRLPFSLTDYLALVDWTGHQLRNDKPGFISNAVPALVAQTGLNEKAWMLTVCTAATSYQRICGSLLHMQAWAQKIGQHWLKGQARVRLLYHTTS